MSWVVYSEEKNGEFEIISETQVIATVHADYDTAKIIASAPELANTCKMIYESLVMPNRHELKVIKRVLEEALTKSGVLK